MASTLKFVRQLINCGDGILILDCDLVQLSIVNEHSERIIFLPYEKNDSPHGEILGLMKPLSRRSFNFSFNSLTSAGSILYGEIEIGWVSGRRSIPKSISLLGGT